MKLMKRFQRYSLVSVAILALGLAGCGGSSNQADDPPPPSPVDIAIGDYDKATGALEAAQGAAATTYAQLETLHEAVEDAAEAVAKALRDAGSDSVAAGWDATAEAAGVQAMLAGEVADAMVAHRTALGMVSASAPTEAQYLAVQAAATRVANALAAVGDSTGAARYTTMATTAGQNAEAAKTQAGRDNAITQARDAYNAAVGMVDDTASSADQQAQHKAVQTAALALADAYTANDDAGNAATYTKMAGDAGLQAAIYGAMDAYEMAVSALNNARTAGEDSAALQTLSEAVEMKAADVVAALIAADEPVSEVDAWRNIAGDAGLKAAIAEKRADYDAALDMVDATASYADQQAQHEAVQAAAKALADAYTADGDATNAGMYTTEAEDAGYQAAIFEAKDAHQALGMVDPMATYAEMQTHYTMVQEKAQDVADAYTAAGDATNAAEWVSTAATAGRSAGIAGAMDSHRLAVEAETAAPDMTPEERVALKTLREAVRDAAATVERLLRAADAAGDDVAIVDVEMWKESKETAGRQVDVTEAIIDFDEAEAAYMEAAADVMETVDALNALKMLKEAVKTAAEDVVDALKLAGMDTAEWDAKLAEGGPIQTALNELDGRIKEATRLADLGTRIAGTLADAENFADALRDHSAVRRTIGGDTPFDDETGAAGTYRVEVHRRGTADADAQITLSQPSGDTAKDFDPPLTDDDPPMIASHHEIPGSTWSSTKLSYTAPTTSVKEEITVYTNIEPPSNVRIADVGETGYPGWADIAGATNDTGGVVTLDNATAFAAWEAGAIELPGLFLDEDDRSKHYDDFVPEDESTEGIDKANFFSGKFYGVEGEFRCTGGSCAARRRTNLANSATAPDDDSDVGALTGTWTFVPDATNASDSVLTGVWDDTDYLMFGYWLQTTPGSDSAPAAAYMVQTFAQGTEPYGDLASVVGTAKYEGNAGGVYSHEETGSGRGGQAEEIATGTFTADVVLNATFLGFSTTIEDDQFRISGTVSSFQNDKGNSIDDDWSVALGAVADSMMGVNLRQDSTPTDTAVDATFGGRTRGHGSREMGAWIGEFHGPSTGAQPTGVSGEFNATFTDGYVAGAFGAGRTESNLTE